MPWQNQLPSWILGFGRNAPPVAQKPGLQRDEALLWMRCFLCGTLEHIEIVETWWWKDHGRIMKGWTAWNSWKGAAKLSAGAWAWFVIISTKEQRLGLNWWIISNIYYPCIPSSCYISYVFILIYWSLLHLIPSRVELSQMLKNLRSPRPRLRDRQNQVVAQMVEIEEIDSQPGIISLQANAAGEC